MASEWQGKIVELYDLWWEKDTTEELPFWTSVAENYFKTQKIANRQPCVVELCSGTGRILIPVAKTLTKKFPRLKFLFYGIDYSPDMNKKLIQRAKAEKLSIHVKEFNLALADWWAPALGNRKVDLFLFPFNHLSLMGDPEIQNNIVYNISKYLVAGGLFVLVDFNPQHVKKYYGIDKKQYRWMVTDEKNNRVFFYWRMLTPSGQSKKHALVTYALDCVEWRDGQLHFESFPMTMPVYYNTPASMDALFRKYGLRTLARYGDYVGTKLKPTSHSQIVIAQKN